MGFGDIFSGVGSVIGASKAAKASAAAEAKAAEFTNKALAALEAVGVPTIEAQKIVLETPEMVFDYAPQLEADFPEIKSRMEEITTDSRLESAQVQALSGLQERADMGLTSAEQAEINALRRETAQGDAANRATIMQQMEQRGLGGSGMELASQLAASQGSAQRASEESDRLAALSFEAKQAALQNLGTMATSQRSQDFSEQAEQASASDIIAQFNQQQASGTQQRNIAAQNAAALQKAQLVQDQETQRAATANQEQTYNKELQQTKFANDMTKTNASGNLLTGAANQAISAGATKAANELKKWEGIGNAVGGAVDAGTAGMGA